MRRVAALLLACVLSGCATTSLKDVATSSDTLAACKVADVATTAYALHSGQFFETNRFLVAFGGAHSVLPAALVGVGLWYVIKNYATPTQTALANGITCGAAALNGWAILR